jgi:heme-degrading monooxygenase HmoA
MRPSAPWNRHFERSEVTAIVRLVEGDDPMSQPVHVIDAPVSEPVTMINAFTVPLAESDRFLQRWKDNVRVMARQPGFVRARMYRSLISECELRFINVAEWASGEALAQARKSSEWRAAVQQMLEDPKLHVTPRPGVYQLAVEVQPGDTV